MRQSFQEDSEKKQRFYDNEKHEKTLKEVGMPTSNFRIFRAFRCSVLDCVKSSPR